MTVAAGWTSITILRLLLDDKEEEIAGRQQQERAAVYSRERKRGSLLRSSVFISIRNLVVRRSKPAHIAVKSFATLAGLAGCSSHHHYTPGTSTTGQTPLPFMAGPIWPHITPCGYTYISAVLNSSLARSLRCR